MTATVAEVHGLLGKEKRPYVGRPVRNLGSTMERWPWVGQGTD